MMSVDDILKSGQHFAVSPSEETPSYKELATFDCKTAYRKPTRDRFDTKEERDRFGCVLDTKGGYSQCSGTASVIASMKFDARLAMKHNAMLIKQEERIRRAKEEAEFRKEFNHNTMKDMAIRFNSFDKIEGFDVNDVPFPCMSVEEAEKFVRYAKGCPTRKVCFPIECPERERNFNKVLISALWYLVEHADYAGYIAYEKNKELKEILEKAYIALNGRGVEWYAWKKTTKEREKGGDYGVQLCDNCNCVSEFKCRGLYLCRRCYNRMFGENKNVKNVPFQYIGRTDWRPGDRARYRELKNEMKKWRAA